MSARTVNRRQLILGAGALGAAAVLGAVVVGRATQDDATGPDADGPTTTGAGPATVPPMEVVAPLDGVAAVGAAYLATGPATADEASLRAVLPELTAGDASGLLDQLGALDPRVRQDFVDGTTVSLDGWVLAVTEAQAAALVSLVR